MTTQSKSYITKSQEQADRVVDLLRAADFSPEEISVLIPERNPREDSAQKNQTEDWDLEWPSREERNILVSVHLKGGSGLPRAEEIFANSRADAFPPIESDDDHSESRVHHPPMRTRR